MAITKAGLLISMPLLIHIGYHKTASTWLQQHVFNDSARGWTTDIRKPRHQIIPDFVTPDVFAFSPDDVRHSYVPSLVDASAKNLTLVLSHERLSGYPPSGGHDRCLIADRLHATFPDARIFMVIREQVGLIKSMYGQYITDGGTISLRDYLIKPEFSIGRMPSFCLELYEFNKLIDYYSKLFGKKNVLTLPYELLRFNAQEFIDRLSKFNDRSPDPLLIMEMENRHRPILMQMTQRHANRLFSKSELNWNPIFRIPRFSKRFGKLRRLFEIISPAFIERYLNERLSRRIKEIVGDYYVESNILTSRLIDIDLHSLGYF